ENPENVRTIGDIYLGRVRRILPGIKAAFVDIGQKQDAFLHFSDLSDNLPDLLELSEGKVTDHLKKHLAKAPRLPEDGGDSGLELETPQEQRAARRRRDLKRTQGRGRRGRGGTQDKAQQQDEAQKQDAPEGEARQPETRRPETRKSDARPQRSSRGAKKQEAPEDAASEPTQEPAEARSEPRRRSATPQPPASDEVPAKAPAILPPDAVAPAPGQETTGPERPTDEASKTDEAPKKRRRGGRGRGRSRTTDQQAETPGADASAEQETAETQR